MAEMATRNPSLPPNYVTLKQLQELRLQEKQREVEEAARLQKIKQGEEEEQPQEEHRRQREPSKSKKSRPPRSNPGASPENLTAIQAPDPKWSVKPPVEESTPNLETKSGDTMKKKKKKKKKRRSKTNTNMKSVGEKPIPKPDNESEKVSGPETVGPAAGRSRGMRCGGSGDRTRVETDVGGVEERSGSTVKMRGRRHGPNLVNRGAVGGRSGMVWVPKSSA